MSGWRSGVTSALVASEVADLESLPQTSGVGVGEVYVRLPYVVVFGLPDAPLQLSLGRTVGLCVP